MPESNAVDIQIPRVAEFYNGKCVFLTGALGYIGSILLEILLRCFPGIKAIYILIRTKNDALPEARKEEMFRKKIFEKIRQETPELLRKVHEMPGDIFLPNLGLNEDDTHLLLEEVSIVFHCAAVLNFKSPMEFILRSNVLSVSCLIGLCRKMRKFEILVYTSTAYSNSNLSFTLKEVVYDFPYIRQFLDALKNEDNEKLQELIAHYTPNYINSYCFSKFLAENVIADMASDLPVAIIRPSIVFSTWKNPIPGYAEENFGLIQLSLGIGKGFIKVGVADPNCKLNFMPADIVANAHVLAAWCVGTKRCASLLVVNCTATGNLHVKVSELTRNIFLTCTKFPLPLSFDQTQNIYIARYKWLYFIATAYYHYLPAIVLDGVLRILRKKPRLFSLYRYIDKTMIALHIFMSHTFEFERNNMDYLDTSINPEDRKDLSLDLKEATFPALMPSLSEGSTFYDWKRDKKSQIERLKIRDRRHIAIKCIQEMFLICICLLIYLVYWMFS